jgi:transposase
VQVKTILNRIHKHRGFVYGAIRLLEVLGELIVEAEIRPRRHSRPACSGCGRRGPGYDMLGPRRFEFVPLWGARVFFVYAMRRVDCAQCGVTVERVPWADGKNRLTTSYAWFLARWAKRMSWKEVAEAFRTSWETVFRSVEMAVKWGREHMSLEGITAIGVDEIARQRGHRYLTLVYQIDEGRKRLLWIGPERTKSSLLAFFAWFGKERSSKLRFICSDMWKNYLAVVAAKASQAIHVLDRFHIMSHMSKAIDQVRANEARALKAKGLAILTHTRWLLLKRPEHLTDKQDVRLVELLQHNLRTVRAYLLKEHFQVFWFYLSPYWAGRFLDRWCTKAMRSRIEPMKKVARMLRAHRSLLLNWFRARGRISAGAVEGFNNKARVITRRAFGFRTYSTIEIALYHGLGDLPEPKFTHRFC